MNSEPTWHVLEVKRSCEIKAAREIARQGFEAYVPLLPREKQSHSHVDVKPVLRFPPYIFAKFSRNDPWGLLQHDDGERAGIVSVLCDGSGYPRPVPEEAITAMRRYVPPVEKRPDRITFHTGEPVVAYIAGVAQRAVFIAYGRGGRAVVNLWILGAERTQSVPVNSVEPAPVDSEDQISALGGRPLRKSFRNRR